MCLIEIHEEIVKKRNEENANREAGQKLKNRRKACHVTQEFLAKCLGVERTTVRKIEAGNRAGEYALVANAYDLFLKRYEWETEWKVLDSNFVRARQALMGISVAVLPQPRRRNII